MWFGSQYGLNRYDGYKFKVFKHEPGRTNSLSGVFISSLFKDRSGSLWIGCDEFLDKFDPVTETFTHYRIDTRDARGETVSVHPACRGDDGSRPGLALDRCSNTLEQSFIVEWFCQKL
jgi:hypothetical protein